jgi:RNA polymerase sigma-70 factor (family 1)
LDRFLSDIELVRRLQKDDVEAFDLIYEKYSGKLYLFGLKYLSSSVEAEELVQSVFLKIWENHKKLDEDQSLKSYLFTIAYNDICKIFRKRYYHKQFVSESLYINSNSSSETEESIYFESVLNRVQSIIDKLPERQKVIFRKSRIEGKTTKEIAAELGLSPGTIDNYISDALIFMRRSLKGEYLALTLLVTLFSS